MTLKQLDIEYLRAQSTLAGQVVITTSSAGIDVTDSIRVINDRIGIGTSIPAQPIHVMGNVLIGGEDSAYVFPDGTRQNTAASSPTPGGQDGSIQFRTVNAFNGDPTFVWDQTRKRLGVGTSDPRSTLQIRDVGYESTDTMSNNTSLVVLDRFPVPDYRSCHYIVQVTDTNFSYFHTSQIMLIHDGFQAYKSEYNIVTTADKLGEFDCRINGGNVELTFTAFYSSDKNIKVIRTSIEP